MGLETGCTREAARVGLEGERETVRGVEGRDGDGENGSSLGPLKN